MCIIQVDESVEKNEEIEILVIRNIPEKISKSSFLMNSILMEKENGRMRISSEDSYCRSKFATSFESSNESFNINHSTETEIHSTPNNYLSRNKRKIFCLDLDSDIISNVTRSTKRLKTTETQTTPSLISQYSAHRQCHHHHHYHIYNFGQN